MVFAHLVFILVTLLDLGYEEPYNPEHQEWHCLRAPVHEGGVVVEDGGVEVGAVGSGVHVVHPDDVQVAADQES